MAEPTQFSFSLKEVAALLLREQHISEGKWALGFELQVGIGTFGAKPEQSLPGAMVQIGAVTLSKVTSEGGVQGPFVVDAAEIAKATGNFKRKTPARQS